ncbi:Phosphatidylglycerol lysyltransferase [compost metagenome]
MPAIQKTAYRLKAARLFSSLYRLKIIQILIPIAIIGLIIWEGQSEFRRINWPAALHTIRHLEPSRFLLLLAVSFAAVGTVSGYEFVLRRHFKLPLGYWETFRYSWIANTSNSVIGFAGIAGAAMRTFLYRSRGISVATITASIAFQSTITITGISLLAWGDLTGLFTAGSVIQAHPWTYYALWGMALYLPGYLIFQRSPFYAKWLNRDLPRMNASTIAASVGASLLEWLCAGIAFWFVASALLPGLPVRTGLGLYTIAATAGLISLAPGGIGGFDLVALYGLQALGYPPEHCVAVLVLFRILYYLLPWLVGLAMGILEFASGRRKESGTVPEPLTGVFNGWQRLWTFPGQHLWISELGAWALGKLVFISGAVLLLSAATPGLLYRLRFTEELLSEPIMRISHQLSLIIGLSLIILSRGISHRIKRAYQWTLALLCTGALFTFAKAFDYEEAILLLIVALLLYLSRSRFYRVAAPVGRRVTAAWALITLVMVYLYNVIAAGTQPRFLHYLPQAQLKHLILDRNEHTIAAVTALAVTWLAFTLAMILRPSPLKTPGASLAERDKLREFLERNPGNLLTHLLYSGDKSFFWACGGRVLIPYALIRSRLVVLGDPIGESRLVSKAVQEIQSFADNYDLDVVFYQVSPANLPVYHENGYRFFKLGEEALVHLPSFTLSGKANTNLRTVKNRFEREGYSVQVMKPPYDGPFLDRLRVISDEWLNGRREKGFSLGWFDPAYLQQGEIAVLLGAESQILAFASLAPAYDGRQTVSVDLMRHLHDTPNGTMDFLFIKLLEWSKEEGYAVFNLGMAPLSSVGETQAAIREEKLAKRVYEYGGYWYGFKGLRRYKEKFSPEWEPRYLAYPARLSLPVLLVDLIILIARRPKIEKKA